MTVTERILKVKAVSRGTHFEIPATLVVICKKRLLHGQEIKH